MTTTELWTHAFVAGGLHFIFVFFKAFQQRNVAFMHYGWVMPISFFMSTTEVFAVGLIAFGAVHAEAWYHLLPYALTMGIGGGAGAITAMWSHVRYVK